MKGQQYKSGQIQPPNELGVRRTRRTTVVRPVRERISLVNMNLLQTDFFRRTSPAQRHRNLRAIYRNVLDDQDLRPWTTTIQPR
jgi:hypothetical protein